MAKQGIIARLLGLPANTAGPKSAKADSSANGVSKPRPMTADRKALIQEAMRVHGKLREELGEEEIKKIAKAISGARMPQLSTLPTL